jgi:hypothetical protein
MLNEMDLFYFVDFILRFINILMGNVQNQCRHHLTLNILRSKYLGGLTGGFDGFPHSSLHLNVKQMMYCEVILATVKMFMFSD